MRRNATFGAGQANGFVNRRSTVQSRPPAPRTPTTRVDSKQAEAAKVAAPRAEVQNLCWIRMAVQRYGVSLGVAVQAEGRMRLARALPAGERRDAAVMAVAAWMFERIPADLKAVAS